MTSGRRPVRPDERPEYFKKKNRDCDWGKYIEKVKKVKRNNILEN